MKAVNCLLFLAVALLAGCYVGPAYRYRVRTVKPAGIAAEEVVRMSKAGLAENVILEKIKAEGVAARPTSDEIVSLKKEGVSDAVLAAMLSAPVVPESTVETVYEPSYYSYPYYYPYYSPYYYGYGYYPYAYGYWPYYGGYRGYYYPYHSHYSHSSPASHSVGTYRR